MRPITELHSPPPPDWRRAIQTAIVVACFTGCVVLGMMLFGGCGSPPEVTILSATCEAQHTDDVVARVACEIEMLVDDEYAAASVESSMEEEPADRCISGELRYGSWVLGGLFGHPVSAEECSEDHAPFGFGPADRPVSTGTRSAE